MDLYYLYYLDKRITLRKGEETTIGREGGNQIILPDQRVSRCHAVLKWSGSGYTLVDNQSTNGTYVNGSRAAEIQLLDGDRIRIGPHDLQFMVRQPGEEGEPQPGDTIIFEKEVAELAGLIGKGGNDKKMMADRVRKLKDYYNRKRDHLEDKTFRDELTNLYNRRFFDVKLADEIARSARYGRPLSLVMVDIDRFKNFNDEYGHQKGDEVLTAVASILKDSCRTSDTVARYGGEEMALILPETTGENAFKVAEKARSSVQERAEATAGVSITVSMGVSRYGNGKDSPATMIAAADKALYQAKEGGRNRVIMDDEL